jgi:hypothetical protein
MKMKPFSILTTLAVCGGILAGVPALHAAVEVLSPAPATRHHIERMKFSDSAEANMMINAYDILATGDHDYKGHRVKAMHQIEAAAKLLDVKLSGDDKVKQKQILSDEKLLEARNLLNKVLDNAEVKGQPKVSKHISDAIAQLSVALSIK